MANKPINMSKLRSVLKLFTAGKSRLFISKYLGLSRNTVKGYVLKLDKLKLTREDLGRMSDRQLYDLFQMPQEKELPKRLQVLQGIFSGMQKALTKPGMTRKKVWENYRAKNPDGYGLTQFNQYYNKWRGIGSATMHVDHKAGDKMYVDYAGKNLHLIEPQSMERKAVEVFVSILGASQLIYVEATLTQRKEDFLSSVENALHYYGGVPQAIVPDNLKTAVTKSNRYEPTLNEAFEDFAEHYETTILPARAYKPKDKALVEGAVRIVYTAIYTALNDQKFYCLEDLNAAIGKELEPLNNRKLTNRPFSRRQLFNDIEREALKPLPTEKYEIKEVAWATVMKTGHICLQKDKHYYSVPYHFIGRKVKLIWSSKKVSIFYNYECIAWHKRIRSAYSYTTVEDHLASSHKFITQWNPEFFQSWAKKIHPHVERLILDILERKKYPEQAYRSCVGVLSLGKKVGHDRLSKACTRALEYGTCNYKSVVLILEKGLDQLSQDPPDEKPGPAHKNIRGKKYYS